MATLNELGRNSASLTYGPYATGYDLWPTLQAVDQWTRNDTFQGTAYGASGQATLTGVTGSGINTIWTTQARAGDNIMIAGQLNSILTTPTNDASMTLANNLSATITSGVPASIKAISTVQPKQTAGYLSTFVRGDCNGTVSVTNGSTTITGTGTYFLTDATNSVATVAMSGTVAIAVDGTITGSGTSFVTGQGIAPGGVNGLYPGDCIAVTTVPGGTVYYFEIATVGGGGSTDTAATVTVPPTTAIAANATIAKATNGVTGRLININGRLRSIQ